ncbi:MAG: ABC transporter permease [Pirellulales bacterium]|nr:ABC transporter permease [Pirellulales bacterium]
MSLIKIAWRSIRQRALASGMTAFAMGLGVALVVTVLVVHSIIEQSFKRGTIGCNFIVGGKGSQYQLVLNTIFHVEQPLGNIPYQYMEELQNRYTPILQTMVPLCMGHDYKTHPAIATTQDYFDKLTYKDGDKFAFDKGRNFKDENFYEAVVGAKVAQWLGLKLDDEIEPVAPGEAKVKDSHGHHPFKIVGILKPTGTANDRAVFLNIEGFWRCPAHNPPPAEAGKTAPGKEKSPEKKPESAEEHGPDAASGHVHDETCDHEHEINREVSAILIGTKSGSPDPSVKAMTAKISALMELEINKGPVAQTVNPGRVLTTLLDTMVGKIQLILLILAVLVVVEAGIGIMVSMYNSMSDRKHDIAIMRALGASRFTVMAIILLESILLALGGGLFGLLVGHGMVAAMSSVIAEQSGVFVSGLDFRPVELILIPGLIVLAALVGYLPAMYAYKTDVAKSLMAGT